MSKAKKVRKPRHPVASMLRQERRKVEISQLKLAEQMGYHYNTLQDWERGVSSPRLCHLEIWAAALGFRVSLEKIDAPTN